MKTKESKLELKQEQLDMRFSIEDLRKAFEDSKKGGIVKTPVLIDQYGGINIEEHFVANLYPTFEEWYFIHFIGKT